MEDTLHPPSIRHSATIENASADRGVVAAVVLPVGSSGATYSFRAPLPSLAWSNRLSTSSTAESGSAWWSWPLLSTRFTVPRKPLAWALAVPTGGWVVKTPKSTALAGCFSRWTFWRTRNLGPTDSFIAGTVNWFPVLATARLLKLLSFTFGVISEEYLYPSLASSRRSLNRT